MRVGTLKLPPPIPINTDKKPVKDLEKSLDDLFEQYQNVIKNVDFRLDAYHQGERSTSLFNLAWDKVDPWTELNALIAITPNDEDANWRIDIYGQNITDEINVMNVGDATAPLGMSKSIWYE